MPLKPFSKEQLNFFKFCTLVFDEFPKLLRQVFITMWDSKIAVRPGFIVWDDSLTVRNMFLASEGGKTEIPTTKSVEEWDCTALFKATIYARTFGVPSGKGVSTLNDLYLKKSKPLPGSFHPSVQSSTGNQDETHALAIDQLRLLRNACCHSPKPEVVKGDFDNYVHLVKDAVSAVNVDTSFVDDIGNMSEDDFPTEKVQQLRECMKEFQAISMFHENMEKKLSSIDDRTEKIEKMIGNISVGDKRNAQDTLPKPHIPNAVPMFTGREDEIEEITKLITDQSTRLLNIWGSSGFGKTSTAIAVAHHLSSRGYPVYFFKLQSVTTIDELLSKMLSIFKSSLADFNVKPVDKLVSIFRELSCSIFIIFDNLDDLLSSETSSKLSCLFEEFVDSNVAINILFTTRELLENMRDEVEGFQNVRIRPLNAVSSVQFVRKLIPTFSENIVAQVAAICSNVPLAMKLVASLLKNNTEEMVSEILEELKFPENLLKQFEANMQKLFDIPFKLLTLSDKHALISLTVFSSATMSKNAAVGIVSREMGSKSNAAGSLKTLVTKSLIDEDLNGKCYSIHPLIYSFVVDKAKRNDFKNVVNSSRIRFCGYYLCLFEKLNEDFLAGKSVDSPQLLETVQYLSTVMFQSITSGGDENFKAVFRILSKSEIFLFLIGIPFRASLDIHQLYDLAIEKSKTRNDVSYLKLYVSKYFQSIAFSLFVPLTNSEIPEDIRKEVMSLSDGTVAKLCCYEGILQIQKGNMKPGIQVIEKHLEDLQKCADQQLLKCLCLQLLALFYSDLKECSFSKKAVEVCDEVGNYNLFLIDRDQAASMRQEEYKGEPLILFNFLLCIWSQKFVSADAKRYFLSFVNELQQKKENKKIGSVYLNLILTYGDWLLAVLGISSGQETFFNEKVDFLQKTLKSKDNKSSTDGIFSTMAVKSDGVAWMSERLLSCYAVKSAVFPGSGKQELTIDECRNALDICFQQHGKVHEETAFWYVQMGFARYNAEDYTSALQSFDQAHEIMKFTDDGSSRCQDIVADIYFGRGKTYINISKYQSAVASFKEAIRIKRKSLHEETTEIANILCLLGLSQYLCNDLPTALATYKQAVKILKFYAEKRSSYVGINVAYCYLGMGKVYHGLGSDIESRKCFESALEISQEWQDCEQRSFAQGVTYMELLDFEVDENRHTKLLDRSLSIFKDHFKFMLPVIYTRVSVKQLDSGNYQAGLANVQKALDIPFDVTQQAPVSARELMVRRFIETVLPTLLKIGKVELAGKILERAFKMTESLLEGRKPIWMFRCYYLKGLIHIVTREYVSAIESFEYALDLFEVSCEDFDRMEEINCRQALMTAHFHQGAYKDALTSLYEALSIFKDIFPEGSEGEADMYHFAAAIAKKMNNKSLVVSNLSLAYKMHSKVLGKNHPATQRSYVEYARALISQ